MRWHWRLVHSSWLGATFPGVSSAHIWGESMMGRFAALSGVENSEGKCLDGDIYLISGEMMGLGHA